MSVDYYRPRPYAIGGGAWQPKGNVRVVDHQFADDNGVFYPLGDTLFTIVWMAGNDPDMLDRELGLALGDIVRAWGEVDGSSWADRRIDPFAASYKPDLAAALEACWAHGKRVLLTVFASGLIPDARLDEVVQNVLDVCVPRQHMLLGIEIANEDNFTGTEDDLRRLARKVGAALPGLPVLPHSGVMGQFDDVCSADSEHFERTDGDMGWRISRQPFDTSLRVAGAQGEPGGIHLHQGEDVHDQVRMAFMWLVGIVSRFTAFVVHTGAGVRSGGQYDRNMGRPASFADAEMADYPSYVAKCRELAALLPPGVCNWTRTSQSGPTPRPDNFLWSDAIWSDGDDHGASRCYVSYAGNSFVALVFGVLHHANMLTRKHVVAEVHDAYTGAVTRVDVPAGGSFTLPGSATTDAAYVLVGTFD